MLNELNLHYRRYFHALFHPHENSNSSELGLQEAIMLSWPFVIVGVMSNIAFSMIVVIDLAMDRVPIFFPFITHGSLVTFPMLLSLFLGLWGVLLFPLRALFYAYILKLSIGFYQRITKSYSADPTLALDLAASSMSSNVFRMIPAIGDMVQSVAQFLSLLRGLKVRMKINTLAAICILLTPSVILVLFMCGILYSLFLLITLLF